jgi:hypothetical protein
MKYIINSICAFLLKYIDTNGANVICSEHKVKIHPNFYYLS